MRAVTEGGCAPQAVGFAATCHPCACCDTYAHMKITIEFADTLLKEARRVAVRERTTVRALVEEGLRRVVAERNQPSAFQLRRATFRGTGLQPTAVTAPWQDLRELAYEDAAGDRGRYQPARLCSPRGLAMA